jgi:feruloyl esterase
MSFDLETDLALTLANGGFIEASNPNLSAFKARGGKLLLWHGWADPGPAPENTINYYTQAAGATGGGSPEDWMRLFLMPGVAHCGGGVGPDQADFLGAMERWREQGVAPAQITASRNPGREGRSPMTRPLCPFPQVARYTSTGSTDEASSFICAAP